MVMPKSVAVTMSKDKKLDGPEIHFPVVKLPVRGS